MRPMIYRVIVTLCGSTRFQQDFLKWQRLLTSAGVIVLTVRHFGWHDGGDTPEIKAGLDDLHKDKIAISDFVLVIDQGPEWPSRYIGDSTRGEINHAISLGVPFFEISRWDDGEILSHILPLVKRGNPCVMR